MLSSHSSIRAIINACTVHTPPHGRESFKCGTVWHRGTTHQSIYDSAIGHIAYQKRCNRKKEKKEKVKLNERVHAPTCETRSSLKYIVWCCVSHSTPIHHTMESTLSWKRTVTFFSSVAFQCDSKCSLTYGGHEWSHERHTHLSLCVAFLSLFSLHFHVIFFLALLVCVPYLSPSLSLFHPIWIHTRYPFSCFLTGFCVREYERKVGQY